MTRRYFVPDLLRQSPTVSLPEEEAAHAVKVMRIAIGETVELFDGKSYQCTGEVIGVDRRQCLIQCQTPVCVNREPARCLEIAVSLPKPDRAKEMMERLTELGVARLWPIVCARTQRESSESMLEKMRRVVIEACKQSGRNQLLEIMPQQSVDSFVAGQVRGGGTNRYLAMPGGQAIQKIIASHAADGSDRPCCAVIGPEGGLTDEENRLFLDAEYMPIGLGDRILRIETAAVAIASIVLID